MLPRISWDLIFSLRSDCVQHKKLAHWLYITASRKWLWRKKSGGKLMGVHIASAPKGFIKCLLHQWKKPADYLESFWTASAWTQSCSLRPAYPRCPIHFLHSPWRDEEWLSKQQVIYCSASFLAPKLCSISAKLKNCLEYLPLFSELPELSLLIPFN